MDRAICLPSLLSKEKYKWAFIKCLLCAWHFMYRILQKDRDPILIYRRENCSSVQFSSVAQSCLTLCDPMDCSTSGFTNSQSLLRLISIELVIAAQSSVIYQHSKREEGGISCYFLYQKLPMGERGNLFMHLAS